MHLPINRTIGFVLASVLSLVASARAGAQEGPRDGLLVNVPTPITSDAVERIRNAVNGRINDANELRRVSTIVFDFTPDEKPAATPGFGACLELADLISSLKGQTTIAYVRAAVTGHTVLPVLSCKELVVGKAGVIGPVIVENVPALDNVRIAAYRNRAAPERWPIVQKMFDRNVKLVRGPARDRAGVTVYADANDEEALKQIAGNPQPVKGLQDGEFARYTAELAHGVGGVELARARADTAEQLRALYGLRSLTPNTLVGNVPFAYQWTLKGDVDGAMRDSVARVLRDVSKNKGNVLILVINCGGTDLEAARKLADVLVAAQKGEDGREPILVVGFIPDSAPDAAAVVALGCGELVMTKPAGEDAKEADIGNFERYLKSARATDIDAWKKSLAKFAKAQGYPELLIEGMLDREMEIVRARGTNNNRNKTQLMTREQFQDAQARKEDWIEDKVIKPRGVPFHPGASLALELGLARYTVPTIKVTDVCAIYGLTEAKNPDPGWIDKLADFLKIPAVTIILVMLGFIGLILELKVPGLTVPGIIAALCFILVFWSQSRFSGEMFVLAILLFILGLVLVGLEIFVLPGFGACGIFGILCMLAGLGLVTLKTAPQDTSGWVDFGVKVSTYLFAMMGALVFAFVIAKFLPQVPGANRLLLTPPTEQPQTAEPVLPGASAAAELLGAIGTSTTALRPAGVVRFGDKFVDVVSDGGFIPAGTRVQVIAVEGTRIVVKEV
jgi:membrane-bound ClpP family serine protease